MARGELLKKLFISYNKADEFRNVALQIIAEEEKKQNLILAKSLRKSLDNAESMRNQNAPRNSKGEMPAFSILPQEPDKRAALVDQVKPSIKGSDVILSKDNQKLFRGVIDEYKNAPLIRGHGLKVRSKLLFCGPPGCGKTICAEAFANEVHLPLLVVRFDVLVSSYLGETSGNLRKVFDFASRQPAVLFLDEFDAVGRSRDDETEHGELKRVVNSLLQLIDRYSGDGFVVAATNHEGRLDPAIWRRFDEVIFFGKPSPQEILSLLTLKLKNFPIEFSLDGKVDLLTGFSHAEIERLCLNAIKQSILSRRKSISSATFDRSYELEKSRRQVIDQLNGAADPTA